MNPFSHLKEKATFNPALSALELEDGTYLVRDGICHSYLSYCTTPYFSVWDRVYVHKSPDDRPLFDYLVNRFPLSRLVLEVKEDEGNMYVHLRGGGDRRELTMMCIAMRCMSEFPGISTLFTSLVKEGVSEHMAFLSATLMQEVRAGCYGWAADWHRPFLRTYSKEWLALFFSGTSFNVNIPTTEERYSHYLIETLLSPTSQTKTVEDHFDTYGSVEASDWGTRAPRFTFSQIVAAVKTF